MGEFKVYDRVWVMRNNKPEDLVVFAVTESMADRKGKATGIRYHLVENIMGAGWGNNEGEIYPADKIFLTREDLLLALMDGD